MMVARDFIISGDVLVGESLEMFSMEGVLWFWEKISRIAGANAMGSTGGVFEEQKEGDGNIFLYQHCLFNSVPLNCNK